MDNQQDYLKHISREGSVTNIYLNIETFFIKQFPDHQVYVGLWGGLNWGIYRVFENDTLETRPWIAGDNMNGIELRPYHSIRNFNVGSTYYGAESSHFVVTNSGKVFAKSMNGVFQLFPTLIQINSSISSVNGLGTAYSNKIAIYGIRSNVNNGMVLIDSETFEETPVISDFDVYHASALLGLQDRMIFEGYHDSRSQFAISLGFANQSYLTQAYLPNQRLLDFQAFRNSSVAFREPEYENNQYTTTSSTSSTRTSSDADSSSGTSTSSDANPFPENPFGSINSFPVMSIIILSLAIAGILSSRIHRKLK